jgi:hypothetical protein
MVFHKNYNINASEDFVTFSTSKLVTRFVDVFTTGMKPHSIAYLLSRSAHIYCISNLEDEVHSIWIL